MADVPAKLGRWAFIALWIAAGTVMLTDAIRFIPPVGEKYADKLGKGAADLLPSYNSAYAWVEGQNPYHYKLPQLPVAFSERETYTYQYPPTHFLVYVPFVWASGDNFQRAARMQFFVSVTVTVIVGLCVLGLVTAVVPLSFELTSALLPALVYVLLLNPGNQLGLERGQSDMITAALCWGAALCWLRAQYFCAAFLAVAGGLLKGYGVPFGAGLLLLGLRRDAWRGTIAGAVLALGLLLAPVARYLPEAIGVFPYRAKMFWSNWNNQSLYNLIYTFEPSWAAPGLRVLIGFAGVVTGLAWWRLWKAQRVEQVEERAIALALYTCASLIFILAFSLNSLVYDAVLVLPGALFIALTQSQLVASRSKLALGLLGAVMSLAMFGLCAMSVYRVFGRRAPIHADWPLHAAGQLVLLCVIFVVSLLAIRRGSQRAA